MFVFHVESVLLFLLCVSLCLVFFFFFQAEDGIRDTSVTGVQTCALPIYGRTGAARKAPRNPMFPLAARQTRISRRFSGGACSSMAYLALRNKLTRICNTL